MLQACVLVKTFGTGVYIAVTVLLLGNVYLEHVCLTVFVFVLLSVCVCVCPSVCLSLCVSSLFLAPFCFFALFFFGYMLVHDKI